MFALRLLGAILAVVIVLIFVTQIFIPLFQGKPLFPGIRRKPRSVKELEVEVNELHSKVAVLHEERDLTEVKSTLERQRSDLESAINRTAEVPAESNPANTQQPTTQQG